jgi:hypothetical protein
MVFPDALAHGRSYARGDGRQRGQPEVRQEEREEVETVNRRRGEALRRAFLHWGVRQVER